MPGGVREPGLGRGSLKSAGEILVQMQCLVAPHLLARSSSARESLQAPERRPEISPFHGTVQSSSAFARLSKEPAESRTPS